MLDRYLEQNEAVRTVLCLQDRNDLVLSSDHNAFIKEMIELLRPFENVTTDISSEMYVSASKIIPVARGLQRITSQSISLFCSDLRDHLLSQMATRFSNLEEKHVIAIATLFDPRFKKVPFTNQSCIQAPSNKIISDGSALLSSKESESDSPSTSNTVGDTVAVNPVWESHPDPLTVNQCSLNWGNTSSCH